MTKITDVEKQNVIILLIIIKHKYGTNMGVQICWRKTQTIDAQMYCTTVQVQLDDHS